MARILLIEDSPTEAAVITQLLERNGHQVTTSGNAEDGIASCKREKPDLVLMDVVLPGMNGFQATRALTRDADTSHIPVLIVSTKSLDTDRASMIHNESIAVEMNSYSEDSKEGIASFRERRDPHWKGY